MLFSFVIQQLNFFVVVAFAKTAKGYSSLAFELFFFFRQHTLLRGHMFLLLLRCHRQVCQVKVNIHLYIRFLIISVIFLKFKLSFFINIIAGEFEDVG